MLKHNLEKNGVEHLMIISKELEQLQKQT